MQKSYEKKDVSIRIILIVIILSSLKSFSSAQVSLKIGDSIPQTLWNTHFNVINAQQKVIKLMSYKEKLILLDFWHTWCSSCLKGFPKMESLQQKFGNRIKILAVSNQDKQKLEEFFASKNGQQYNNVMSVAGDDILERLFPHLGVPFVVWIKNGVVIYTTDAEQVTESSIDKVLKGEQNDLQNVVFMDENKPLMLSDDVFVEKGTTLLGYSFISKGRIRSASYGTWFHRDHNTIYGRRFTNLTLMEIYNALAYEIFDSFKEAYSSKRLINLVRIPEQIDFNPNLESKSIEDKLYNVDYILPKSQADSLYNRMLDFINANTDYLASVERRLVKCLVLRRTSSSDNIASKGGEQIDHFFKSPAIMKNLNLDYLLSALNANNNFTTLPVIDETGYKTPVDLDLGHITDFFSLKKALNKYDLDLVEVKRHIPMFIIRDKL